MLIEKLWKLIKIKLKLKLFEMFATDRILKLGTFIMLCSAA